MQVRSIIGQVRPDRQTLLFSATMPSKVEGLVRDSLTAPVRLNVGEVGAVNEDIRQVWALSLSPVSQSPYLVVLTVMKLAWIISCPPGQPNNMPIEDERPDC